MGPKALQLTYQREGQKSGNFTNGKNISEK